METNILMESGTNELEVLEFIVGDNHYGINVAKIREIVPYHEVTPIPNTHPSVEGIFMPRDIMITVIDLAKVINLPQSEDVTKDMFIITNFNKLNVAFHIKQVNGIHRVSWADIITPDPTISSADNGIATGIVKIQGRLIVILDFERIVSDISPETGLKVSDINRLETRERNNIPIVVAEDSPLLGKLIADSLSRAGYVNIRMCANGQEAWDWLCSVKKKGGNIDSEVRCVITDLEMPLMDGHRLTKLIKEDEELKHIPVVIFSSLINEQMKRKGEALGADIQLSKPEIGKLVDEIDRLLLGVNN
ncbi:MAG: chemotaxis protein [Lachnospiraceae bacterium]